MAQARFYYYPRDEQDDTAVCFQCGLALDGWEVDDSPRWTNHSELIRSCLFVGMSMKSADQGAPSSSPDKFTDLLALSS